MRVTDSSLKQYVKKTKLKNETISSQYYERMPELMQRQVDEALRRKLITPEQHVKMILNPNKQTIFFTKIDMHDPITEKVLKNTGLNYNDVRVKNYSEFQNDDRPEILQRIDYMVYLTEMYDNLQKFLIERSRVKKTEKDFSRKLTSLLKSQSENQLLSQQFSQTDQSFLRDFNYEKELLKFQIEKNRLLWEDEQHKKNLQKRSDLQYLEADLQKRLEANRESEKKKFLEKVQQKKDLTIDNNSRLVRIKDQEKIDLKQYSKQRNQQREERLKSLEERKQQIKQDLQYKGQKLQAHIDLALQMKKNEIEQQKENATPVLQSIQEYIDKTQNKRELYSMQYQQKLLQHELEINEVIHRSQENMKTKFETDSQNFGKTMGIKVPKYADKKNKILNDLKKEIHEKLEQQQKNVHYKIDIQEEKFKEYTNKLEEEIKDKEKVLVKKNQIIQQKVSQLGKQLEQREQIFQTKHQRIQMRHEIKKQQILMNELIKKEQLEEMEEIQNQLIIKKQELRQQKLEMKQKLEKECKSFKPVPLVIVKEKDDKNKNQKQKIEENQ